MTDDGLISLDLIDRLISFDTTSNRSNLPLIKFVQGYLAERGIESHLTFDDSGEKANLFASLGPVDRPGIILSGHTDIVPVANQNWTVDPYAVTRKGDRLYGRGMADMKAYIAVSLAFANVFRDRGVHVPIHYALSYDEEVGALGVPRLIQDLLGRVAMPIACIVGEPSNMNVVKAHKGKIVCRAEFKGLEAHSGVAHIGANAIEAAGRTIAYVSEMGRKFRDEGPYDEEFEDPKYTTVQICMVNGGTAVNIVPNFASFDFDIRHLPSQDPYDILADIRRFMERSALPELRRVSDETEANVIVHPGGAIALDTNEDNQVIQLAKTLTETSETHKVGFGTEAGYFQQAGIPTVVCGPGHVDQAHQPDEFVEIEQVALCERFFRNLSERLSSGRL